MTESARNPLTALSLADLRQRTSAKWRRYAPDVLPLYVAEMDTPLAPPVQEALSTAIARGDTGYPEGHAYEEALAQFATERWKWTGLSAQHMVPVPDVITGYVDAACLVTEPGDHVVVNPPVYPPFFSHIRGAGREISEAPLDAAGRIDLETLEAAFDRAKIAGKRAAYLLCSPHNPTGVVHTRAELEAVAALTHRYEVRVIADEIHAPLVYSPGAFVPYLTVSGGENGVSLMAASKAWNLAGLKGAIMIAGDDADDVMKDYRSRPRHGASHLGAIAQTAAYLHGSEWLADLMDGLDANRARLETLIHEQLPDVRYTPPEATYLAWLDCRGMELAAPDLGDFFVEEARVALNSGPTFGTGGEGHVRLNFATHPDILTEAIRRMAAATAEI